MVVFVKVFSTLSGFVVELNSRHLPKKVFQFPNYTARKVFEAFDLERDRVKRERKRKDKEGKERKAKGIQEESDEEDKGREPLNLEEVLQNKGDSDDKHALGSFLADQIQMPYASWWTRWPVTGKNTS